MVSVLLVLAFVVPKIPLPCAGPALLAGVVVFEVPPNKPEPEVPPPPKLPPLELGKRLLPFVA
jgi:hypothetical protein